ncbi:MAG: hypothetical protein ACFE0O_03500 [Opitutales bacterium]
MCDLSDPADSQPPAPTLPKWPFVLGDGLLLALALVVLLRSDGPLTGWEVGFCVVSVGFGGVLFAVPFLAEYVLGLRQREQVAREGLDQLLTDVRAGFTALDGALGHRDATLDRLDNGVDAQSSLVERLRKAIEPLESALNTLHGQQTNLAAVGERLEQAWDGQTSALDDRLDRLTESLQGWQKTMDGRFEALDKQQAPVTDPVLLERLSTLEEQIGEILDQLQALRRQSRRRQEASGEVESAADKANLLGKALSHARPGGPGSAVDRLIRPDSVKDEPVAESQPEPVAEDLAVSESAPAAPEPEGPQTAAEARPVEENPPAAKGAPAGEGPPSPEAGGSVAADAEPVSRVVANILPGIGNKLYIRGSGGGLSWDDGQLLTFAEIGKYVWEAPALQKPIRLQLYLNDAVPAAGDPVTLNPGETLDLAPDFPR